MISITDKHNCCGCFACASACPKQCISMVFDREGFLYPKIEKELCIECDICSTVCNVVSPMSSKEPIRVLAAINKDEEIRRKSSSGGVFYSLAESFIKNGGVVFGARFDENWQVVIDYSEDLEGIKAFMGSKYVQARIDYAYKNARHFLEKGRRVLFSGTPCQVAGLHKYLREQYDNLITVDFVCHGTPSPGIWGGYIERGKDYLCGVEFRNKKKGWQNYCLKLDYNLSGRKRSTITPHAQDLYMRAFLFDYILRPSCYSCKAKDNSSHSDITLADFWGIQKVFPELDDDKGTSLLFVNSIAGEKALNLNHYIFKDSTYDCAKILNPSCYQSTKEPIDRNSFFDMVEKKGERAALKKFVGANGGLIGLIKKIIHRILSIIYS